MDKFVNWTPRSKQCVISTCIANYLFKSAYLPWLLNVPIQLFRAWVSRGFYCIKYGRSKVLVNSTNENLDEINYFKRLGSTLGKDGTSTKEIKIRIAAQWLCLLCQDLASSGRDISFQSKFKLYRALNESILLCGCESWTLTAETERRVQTFETKFFRRHLRISYIEHKTHGYVRQQVDSLAGNQEPLLATVKRRKLSCYGHITRYNTIAKPPCKAHWRTRDDGPPEKTLAR